MMDADATPVVDHDLMEAILSLNQAIQALMRAAGVARHNPLPVKGSTWLSVAEAALYLRLSDKRVFTLINQGVFETMKARRRSRNGKHKTLISAASLGRYAGRR